MIAVSEGDEMPRYYFHLRSKEQFIWEGKGSICRIPPLPEGRPTRLRRNSVGAFCMKADRNALGSSRSRMKATSSFTSRRSKPYRCEIIPSSVALFSTSRWAAFCGSRHQLMHSQSALKWPRSFLAGALKQSTKVLVNYYSGHYACTLLCVKLSSSRLCNGSYGCA